MLDANYRGDVDGSIDALERIYGEAVCVGGSLSTWRAHEERVHSAIELLARITTHTPYLTLLVLELVDARGAAAACLAREARRHAALVIRLAHRALEVHARDLGYELDVWRERAVLEADAALAAAWVGDRDDELGLAASAVVDATIALAAAIVAVSCDCMAVPDHLASAPGRLVALLRARRPYGATVTGSGAYMSPRVSSAAASVLAALGLCSRSDSRTSVARSPVIQAGSV